MSATLDMRGWQMVLATNDPNPVIATRDAGDGGTARLYADGMVDAVDGALYSVSPGFNEYAHLLTWIEVQSDYARVEREYGEYLALLEQERHEAEDEYLATCYGHQMSVQDESTAGDPGEW